MQKKNYQTQEKNYITHNTDNKSYIIFILSFFLLF